MTAAALCIVSGFLGSGKTTLIRKLLADGLEGKRVALIENEFGEVGIDGPLLRGGGLPIREISSGCICCTLAGEFTQALGAVLEEFRPQVVLVEPSGVAGLSDLLRACRRSPPERIGRVRALTVVDASCHMEYAESFGDFYRDQIACAGVLVCSRTQELDGGALDRLSSALGTWNPGAACFLAPWEHFTGCDVLAALDGARGGGPGTEAHGHDHSARLFTSVTLHPAGRWTREALACRLEGLSSPEFGRVVRAKGFLPGESGQWLEVQYAAGGAALTPCAPQPEPALVVIGTGLRAGAIGAHFAQYRPTC